MSRAEAIAQFNLALKQGRKYYNTCVAKGQYPFPQVLNEILDETATAGTVNLGLVDIPTERIIGTWTEGRKNAFAGNFMPLLDANTEFGAKWIDLCNAHLSEEGITDPIKCIEYMGQFYVQEGHKRVSVLRSYEAVSIPGYVSRIIPAYSEEDVNIQIYYEFMKFYKVSKLYTVSFTQLGGYAKLSAATGLPLDQEWTEEARRGFHNDIRRFSEIYDQLNTEKLPLTAGDALLIYLQMHPYADMKSTPAETLRQQLTALWPDIRLQAKGDPIEVSKEPEEQEKGLLSRILGSHKVHVAFLYDHDPQSSAWASAHELGKIYLEEKLKSSVPIDSYICEGNGDEAFEAAISNGANALFATSPTLIGACRRIAAKYKNVAVFNCSLSQPYTGVRSYYCRIYEGKFITGAIAGAMAREDRIGYVANYPIMGVPAAINAFALGARLTNPRARISLKWTCLPGNPTQEFLQDGVTVISNRDEDGAKSYLAWDLGTYQILPGQALQMLASPRWNWGRFYEKTVLTLMNNGVESVRNVNQAVTDWWGLSAGVVDVDIDHRLPCGVKQLAAILKDGIVQERIDPFRCCIHDQAGRLISDGSRSFSPEELMRMDWLCDNVEGVIPAFEELLPQSQNLTRILGVYRQAIPPTKAEDTAP